MILVNGSLLFSNRLLDENDAEIQMKVLDCLLVWKDDFLIPYHQHLRNLINSKSLREELTTWSLSRESHLIEDDHRSNLVPLVICLLMPKVRKLKTLASRKVGLCRIYCLFYFCHISIMGFWTCIESCFSFKHCSKFAMLSVFLIVIFFPMSACKYISSKGGSVFRSSTRCWWTPSLLCIVNKVLGNYSQGSWWWSILGKTLLQYGGISRI